MSAFVQKLKSNVGLLLIFIIVVSVFFRLWNINNFDISGDNSLYSFRALGWLDFIPGEGQTGPMQWFGERPTWAAWSFQDSPPAVFALQHISFTFFGDNTFAARLPFVLAGILTVLMVFWILKKYADTTTALIGALLMGISSYAVWASFTGFLEGIMVLFISLCLYFVLPWAEINPNNSISKKYLWPIFAGFSLLSKYTSLFLLPSAAISIIIFWKKKIFSLDFLKHISISLCIMILVLLPVIIYNIEVYHTRGHFDSSLSAMLGISSPDFSILKGRQTSFNIFQNILPIIKTLLFSNSLPYFTYFFVSLIWLLIRALKKRSSAFENVLIVHIFFMILMFAFSSVSAVRFLSIFSLFMATVIALFVVAAYRFLMSRNKLFAYIFLGISILCFSAEVLYSLNTNILQRPIGEVKSSSESSFFYSTSRIYDRGWNNAEKYITKNIFTNKRPIRVINTSEEILKLSDLDFKDTNILLYDERLNWFALSWHINKYLIYYKFPLFKISVLGERFGNMDFLTYMKSFSGKDIYFLYGVDGMVLDSLKQYGQIAESTKAYAKSLDKAGVSHDDIKNGNGDVMFRIYKIK